MPRKAAGSTAAKVRTAKPGRYGDGAGLYLLVRGPALPWQDVGAFMSCLANLPGLGQLALRFTILTSSRTSEAIEARWPEIDLAGGVWTVPPTRMKGRGGRHRVPLSEAALAVLIWSRPCAMMHVEDGFFLEPERVGL